MSGPESILDMIRLKYRREDFCVTESLALNPALRPDADAGDGPYHQYCRLKKSGITTFQAIEKTAEFLGIDPLLVTYCGLKDEDGITDQMIAFPRDAHGGGIDGRKPIWTEGESYIEIVPYGTYREPLEIGGLAGNAFRICVRGVPVTMRGRLEALGGSNPAWFINYYDTQRFGVPGGPRTTHRIGAALLAEDFDAALDLLKKAKTPEQESALKWQGEAKQFFAALDHRLIAFFMSADSSFQWNRTVQDELAAKLPGHSLVRYERDGLAFHAVRSASDLQSALSGIPTVDYRRYRAAGDRYDFSTVPRPTLVQTTIRTEHIDEDEDHPGRLKLTVSFFLPSGCYATNVVNQWMLSLQTE